jgi:two-component system cell cycle response regulator
MATERKTTSKMEAVRPRETLTEGIPTVDIPDVVRRSSHPPDALPRSEPASGRPPMLSLSELEHYEEDTDVGRLTPIHLQRPADSTKRDRAILTVITGLHAGQIFSLDSDSVVIGRGRDTLIRIDDAGISRQHTCITRNKDGSYSVEDLGSTNGTFIGARRIVDKEQLTTGDRIQIGSNIVLRFAVTDGADEALARQLYEASTRDSLTRIFNRKYFFARLNSEIAYGIRHKTLVSVILFDIDHFKRVNDEHGHLGGDVVLRLVAAQVEKSIRLEDVLARYGGEEFAILVRGIEHARANRFGERIRAAVERLVVPWEGKSLRTTVSVGVASLNELSELATGEGLLGLADVRLYRAKQKGRNRVCAEGNDD